MAGVLPSFQCSWDGHLGFFNTACQWSCNHRAGAVVHQAASRPRLFRVVRFGSSPTRSRCFVAAMAVRLRAWFPAREQYGDTRKLYGNSVWYL